MAKHTGVHEVNEEPTPATSRFTLPLSNSIEVSLFQQTNAGTGSRSVFRCTCRWPVRAEGIVIFEGDRVQASALPSHGTSPVPRRKA